MTEAERFDRICSIFESVRELNGPEQAAKLDELCADEDGIRAEVEEMLGVHASVSPLDQSSDTLLDRLVSAPAIDRKPEIDRYEIGKRIGEGGMGVVYSAQMRNPSRAVAIKVIRLGMDSERVIARFELERRALARMEHPNIASVLDAGVTSDGRPYFAMELVRGEPIVRFCDEHAMGTDERLRLLIQVCHAIQHAHQKGIIHRDIKPSNVIVTEHDASMIPKVIDFGIAKATQGGMKPEATMTMQAQAIGTPAYMSPEQADHTLGDIDTRTDVYSLGVLLYELLTGSTPLTNMELTSKSYQEIVQSIREQEPPKPSTRLATLSGTRSSVEADQEFVNASSLRGDLDCIVMKCLEKDMSRRYDTVSALSDDLGRFLRNEPVMARPASRAYLTRKFVRRHRGEVIAASALLGVLLLGIAGSTAGLLWALEEREIARDHAVSELAAQVEATEAANRAKSEAQAAEDLSEFFIMDVLSAADPSRAADRELTVRQALVNASENIEGKFEDRPDVESRIHNALGYLFGQLGSPELAERHHIREWEIAEQLDGEGSIEVARMMHSVVGSLARQGRDTEAIRLTERQLEIIDQLGSPEGEQLRPRAIGNLGALLARAGRSVEAAPILEDVLRIKREQYGDRHPTTLATINGLATVLRSTGNLERSFTLSQEAYDGRVEVLGDGDPRTFNSLMGLIYVHTSLEQHEQAISLARSGIEHAHERLGSDHPTSLDMGNAYARALYDSRDFESAEQAARELLVEMESVDPTMSQGRSLSALSLLAGSLSKQDRFDEAVQVSERIVETARGANSGGGARFNEYLRLHGGILSKLGAFERAESVLLEAWEGTDREVTSDEQYRTLVTTIIELYESWMTADPEQVDQAQIQIWRSRL